MTDFFWGVATSAHQVEGNNTNSDWWRHEQRVAEKRAKHARSRFSHLNVWPDIQDAAQTPGNYISRDAVNHVERYEEDIELAAQLGLNAFRFSLSWAKLMPEKDTVDGDVIAHYKQVLQKIRSEGMEPFVTLWHFVDPAWLADNGGWSSKTAVQHFTRYVETANQHFSDDVEYWMTFNEPTGWLANAYLGGRWPPAKHHPLQAYWAFKHIVQAHHAAYDILDSDHVGIAANVTDFRPYNHNPANQVVAKLLRYLEYEHLIDTVSGKLDWIGVNHYRPRDIDVFLRSHAYQKSDLGWKLDPESLYNVLLALDAQYELPLIVTEHGLADRHDDHRSWFLTESLAHLERARQDGVDVNGYLHWSLLDNFEWDKGFWPRFGLVEVDRETGERTLRPSAKEYADHIHEQHVATEAEAASRARNV